MASGQQPSPLAPPPPPPPPRSVKQPCQEDESQKSNSGPFVLCGEGTNTLEFEFPKARDVSGNISLRTVVGTYLGSPQSTKTTFDKVFHILGRLRCLQYALRKYNDGLSTQSAAFLQYWRRHTLDILSGFGFYVKRTPAPLHIAGLDEIIHQLEAIRETSIQEARDTIDNGKITFGGLSELFRPETHVKASIIAGSHAPCVFRVTDAYYEERRSLFGSQTQFRVTLEAVIPVGDHFSVVSFSEVIPAWSGARACPLADFTYSPVSAAEQELLLARAEHTIRYGGGGAKYLAYSIGSFYIHAARSRPGGNTMCRSINNSQTLTGGRVMVDMARGASLGHFPCQGVDEATLSIISLSARYRQWLSKQSQPSRSEASESESLLIWDQVPPEFLITCWPALVGFSFSAKAWGHVIVDGLSHIDFQDHAYDRLVLSQERKQLIRAVVRCGTAAQTQDLVTGKQGGLIFLLHGPPGVGKTLTAEAVAEVLHRPLYYITMGELGVTPEELETRLTDVLDLCAEWDALAVLDEADVFLETRGSADFVRNAMVCVMLRILEYHPGILFLTTNRVRNLDPAFESRITLAIRYEALNHDARRKVWESQLGSLAESVASGIDCAELAAQQLNGRQIKNTMRLALSLATDQDVALTQSILLKTIEVTSLGTRSMGEDSTWEAAVDLRSRR